jgi:Rrf2 family protein
VALQLARAEPGVPVSCAWLAREGRLPQRYLQHILRRLVNHGVVRSTRGVVGGYVLARDPQQITLRHLVQAVDIAADSQLSLIHSLRAEARSQLTKALRNASRAMNAELQSVTVADLVGETQRRSRR